MTQPQPRQRRIMLPEFSSRPQHSQPIITQRITAALAVLQFMAGMTLGISLGLLALNLVALSQPPARCPVSLNLPDA